MAIISTWYVGSLYERQGKLGIFVAIFVLFHKKANLFVYFKVWQNQNVIKPTYWSNENYPTMCFVTSRLRRHAKIVMSTLNADIKLTQLFSFKKIIHGKWEEIISHPQCFGYKWTPQAIFITRLEMLLLWKLIQCMKFILLILYNARKFELKFGLSKVFRTQL